MNKSHRPHDSNHHHDHSDEHAHDEGNADGDGDGDQVHGDGQIGDRSARDEDPGATRRRRATPVSATPGMSMPGMSMPDVPDNPNLAPPGWYMLFLCDQQGIPSIATWVHLAQPAPQPELLHGHVRHTHTDHQREHQPGFPIPGFPLPGPSRTE